MFGEKWQQAKGVIKKSKTLRKGAKMGVKIEFPAEKILTISAADYCGSVGRKLSDYKMVGVQGSYFSHFQEAIPAGTEVIVGFIEARGFSGTALVPLDD